MVRLGSQKSRRAFLINVTFSPESEEGSGKGDPSVLDTRLLRPTDFSLLISFSLSLFLLLLRSLTPFFKKFLRHLSLSLWLLADGVRGDED